VASGSWHFPAPHYVLADISEKTLLATHVSVTYQFRALEPTDGMALHRLVRACPPLDSNSSYCNLLQCSHFQATSIAAVSNEDLIGSVTAYRIPERPDTLFIWQVAVHPNARGHGLASTMLRNLLARLTTQGIRFVETSITADNEASWRLFTGFAAEQSTKIIRSAMFDKTRHFQDEHDTEHLARIGPLEVIVS